jgi:putative flippase GtrA
MTDVFGANRSGIEAIWVRRLEGKEFKGTSINRRIERVLTGAIYQALVTPLDETPGTPEEERAKPVAQKTLVHQIIKFGIVGGSSFLIDFGFTYIFMKLVPWGGGLMSDHFGTFLKTTFPALFAFAKGPSEAALPLMSALASIFAMTNSFFLNRAWTFEVRGKEERARQMTRFYIVCIIGQVIGVGVATFLYNLNGRQELLIPKVLGALVGGAWNFIGSRLWAFSDKA